MSFLLKSFISEKFKILTGGLPVAEDSKKSEEPQSAAEAQGMTREEHEEYQRQLVEEKMERDARFMQKRAERAAVRVHFREKYRLPESDNDASTIQLAPEEVELPEELSRMTKKDEEEEEEKNSFLGHLQTLQNADVDALRQKAQAGLLEAKQAAEQKCIVM
uniref:complexin-4 n=1 Tax=Myxine glutinosa TaxID=7769 RepID=UPI00358F0336